MLKKPALIMGCIAMLTLASCQTAEKMSNAFGGRKPNEGPCPVAMVLWDAARKIQISEPEIYSNVGFTGEVTGVRSYCTYVGDEPIRASLEIDFAYGRGPSAVGMEWDYPYFVSVTRKNRAVIAKERFPVHIKFKGDDPVVRRTEKIESIVIPRAQVDTSGANFEIIVGFELSAAELAFARSGKRFRVDAGSSQ